MVRLRLKVYSRGFTVAVGSVSDKQLMTDYCNDLAVFEERVIRGRGKVRIRTKTYATFHPRTQVYGLHRGMLDNFLSYLERKGLGSTQVETEYVDGYTGTEANLTLSDKAVPFDYQEDIIKFTLKGIPAAVLPLQTGKGKTFIGLYTAAKLKTRTAVVTGSMHINTWLKDAGWMIEDSETNIRVVRGKKGMMKIIQDSRDHHELVEDLLFITTNTLRDFLTEFETLGRSTYGCTPLEFYKVIGVGYRITDEAHENLHFQFRHDIETDSPQQLYLSSTIQSNDPFTNRMYEAIYPHANRYIGLPWDKYIEVTAMSFTLDKPDSVRCTGGTGMYSHTAFEQWISGCKLRQSAYLKMFETIIDHSWKKDRVQGDKILIFFETVSMCVDFSEILTAKYPELLVSDFTAVHDITVLHSNDVIISTPGSCGTGKDIKGLNFTLNTIAVNSRERNIQMLGRLRKLQDKPVKYFYMVAVNLRKPLQYHENKIKMFTPLVKNIRCVRTNFNI